MDPLAAPAPGLVLLDFMWADEDVGWSILQMLYMDRHTAAFPAVVVNHSPFNIELLGDAIAALAWKPAAETVT
jgi:hypothetical protein